MADARGVPAFISHHKIYGYNNWGSHNKTIKIMEDAIKEGISVTCDQYPYDSCMSYLHMCIPPWYYDKGIEATTKMLKNSDMRAKIKEEMQDRASVYDNYYLNAGGWHGVYISSAKLTPDAEGKTIKK